MIEFFKRLFRRERYFFISYRMNNWGMWCTTTVNNLWEFVNIHWFVEFIKDTTKCDGVIITSIFEFKNKRDYNSFNFENIS